MITLTTDFGLSDHFVGVMKGVILSIAPKVRIVDVTHDVAPFAVPEAAFVIAQTWRYFPKGTIHVVVVDPGVGSERRAILVEADGHFFVGPDNGVFSMIYGQAAHRARVISNPKFMLQPVSRSFHGRDVFAPAAAHLVRGAAPARFGMPASDLVRLVESPSVLKVDRFGNLITSLHVGQWAEIQSKPFEIRLGRKVIRKFSATYAELKPGELFAMIGSSGYVEIAISKGSAAELLKASSGTPIEVRWR